MNYRHGFHAGNHADVFKHVVALELLHAMQRKPAAIFLLDTHAGRGSYDLGDEQARKTGEAQSGIERIRHRKSETVTAAVARYLKTLDACSGGNAGHYPGSPRLLLASMRKHDRLAGCELHPAEAKVLRQSIERDPRASVHERDGYAALSALLPASEKRVFVLIDPPYEAQLAEFDAVFSGIKQALQRVPDAVIAVWFPIKERRKLNPMMRRAASLPAKGVLTVELIVRPAESPLRLNGSGMLICNPPWQVERELGPALDELRVALDDGAGKSAMAWLKTESSNR